MRGVISTTESNPDVLVERARSIRKMDGTDLASVVTTKDRYEFESDGPIRSIRTKSSRVPTFTSSPTTTASRKTSCAC